MADTKISDLADGVTADATDRIPIARAGANNYITPEEIRTFIEGEANVFSEATQIASIELGHASDTTLTRTGAGAIAVEGVGVALNSTSLTHTASTIELGHASDTTLARAAAGEVTIEGVRVKKVGKETIYIPAGAMTSRASNGAAAATTTINTISFPTLAFDQSTDEGANFSVCFPKSWNAGTVTFQAFWTAASGSGDVQFELRGGSFANDAAINVTGLGTAVAVDDTLIATSDVHVTSESAAITLSNAADDTVTWFEILRDVSDDTLSGDALLIGIKLFFTTDASTDA